jgi:uncharacterized protein (DUF1501 family)
MRMFSRRDLLRSSAGLLGAGLLGLHATAAAPGSRHKLIVYFVRGGWDTTKVFWPPWDLSTPVQEPDASEATANGITFVDHPNRQRVRRFFESYGDVTAVLDGMLVRSVNHQVCERLVLTGGSRTDEADWPSVLGAAAASEHALPSVVLSGPSWPGPLQRYSSIVGSADQLQSLIDRRVFRVGDQPIDPPSDAVFAPVDALLEQRVAARLATATDPGQQRMLSTMDDGLARMARLRDEARQVAFEGSGLSEQARTAVSMLRYGIARCVSMEHAGFDMHSFVDEQDPLLDLCFATVGELIELLRITPSPQGGVLADDTTVLVISEMGRTPYRNNRDGKDHWPYTSCMLIGAGIRGGTKIGGHNSALSGLPINLLTGAVDPSGTVVTPANLGATLMSLSGLDPETRVPGYAPISALLS